MESNKKQTIILAIYWVASFIPSIVGLILFGILLVFWISSLIQYGAGKRKWFLLFSPIMFFFITGISSGITSYIKGTATFYFDVEDYLQDLSSDKDFEFKHRVYYYDFRGEHYGNSYYSPPGYLIHRHLNDESIKLLVKSFGYQKNMYSGKFPTSEKIISLIEKKQFKKVYLKSANQEFVTFNLNGKLYKLSRGNKSAITISNPPVVEPYGMRLLKKSDYGEKLVMNEGSFIYLSDKYKPLIILFEFDFYESSYCIHIQYVDINSGTIFANLSLYHNHLYSCHSCNCQKL